MVKKLSIYKRLTSPTPKIYRIIRRIGAILSAISIMVLAGNTQFDLELPAIVDKIGQYIAYVGFIAVTIASLTVDTEKLKEEEQNS